MSNINNENYILIQGFMVNELKLKGNELLVYAIIYGFSQDEESGYRGGRSYLAKWCNTSLPTIDNALKNLEEKEYIIKEQTISNNLIFNRYKISWGVLKKFYGGYKDFLGGYKKTLYNNTIYNTNKNNINNNIVEKKSKKPTLEEIENYIKEKNYNVNPNVFYEYFEANNWIDSKGNKVKSWKQKLVTWNSFNKKENKIDNPIPKWFNDNIKNEPTDEEINKINELLKEFKEEDRNE